jgi:hypothetical protein
VKTLNVWRRRKILGNLKERDHLKDLCADDRILKWILKQGPDSSGLGKRKL